MPSKKSAIFIINGFGLGNATRCEAMMDLLKDRYEFDVVTSDKAFRFYEGKETVRSVFRQSDVNLRSQWSYGSILFFVRYTFSFIPRIFNNYRIQRSIISNNKYDLLFFDSDYSFILHRLAGKHSLITINNAFEVVRFFKDNPSYLKGQFKLSVLIETLDFLVCKVFSNFIICPSISWQHLQKLETEKLLITPLLVRSNVLRICHAKEDKVLIVPSSSGEKSDISAVSGLLQDAKSLMNRFEKDNVESLQKASVIFCNAGQSSISECLYMRKPAVLFPIPRHAEQLANSILAEREGLTVYRGQKVSDLVENCKSSASNRSEKFDYDMTKSIFEKQIQKIESATGNR